MSPMDNTRRELHIELTDDMTQEEIINAFRAIGGFFRFVAGVQMMKNKVTPGQPQMQQFFAVMATLEQVTINWNGPPNIMVPQVMGGRPS